jgi:hypothetical protein
MIAWLHVIAEGNQRGGVHLVPGVIQDRAIAVVAFRAKLFDGIAV